MQVVLSFCVIQDLRTYSLVPVHAPGLGDCWVTLQVCDKNHGLKNKHSGTLKMQLQDSFRVHRLAQGHLDVECSDSWYGPDS